MQWSFPIRFVFLTQVILKGMPALDKVALIVNMDPVVQLVFAKGLAACPEPLARLVNTVGIQLLGSCSQLCFPKDQAAISTANALILKYLRNLMSLMDAEDDLVLVNCSPFAHEVIDHLRKEELRSPHNSENEVYALHFLKKIVAASNSRVSFMPQAGADHTAEETRAVMRI